MRVWKAWGAYVLRRSMMRRLRERSRDAASGGASGVLAALQAELSGDEGGEREAADGGLAPQRLVGAVVDGFNRLF